MIIFERIFFLILFYSLVSCKKDSELCDFIFDNLKGKLYSINQITKTQNGEEADITQKVFENSCYQNSISFLTNNKIVEVNPASCNLIEQRGFYKLYNQNNKDYLDLDFQPSNALLQKHIEVIYFDCETIIISSVWNGEVVKIKLQKTEL